MHGCGEHADGILWLMLVAERGTTARHTARVEPAEPIDPTAFAAVDMRVGQVLEVRPFPEARRPAWQLHVDFGPELGRRWTSAQVTSYTAEELVGRRVVGAINLGTRRIAGFASEFLLLGAVQADGSVVLLDVAPSAALGSRIA